MRRGTWYASRMPRQRVAVLLSAFLLGASAVIAACSGFSSEETSPTSDVGDGATDSATGDSSATDAASDVVDGAMDAGASTTYGPYDFENGELPWGASAPGSANRVVKVQQGEHYGDGGFALFASATSQLPSPTSAFMGKSFGKVRSLEMTTKLFIYKRCPGPPVTCPTQGKIWVLGVGSSRIVISLRTSGFTVQRDNEPPFQGSTGTDSTWLDGHLALAQTSTGYSVSVALGDETKALSWEADAGAAIDTVSLDIGVDVAAFIADSYGYAYFLDNLQITTTP